MDSLDKTGNARSLAQVVVETVREPLLVLNEDLTILAASESFHKSFQITHGQTFHRSFFALDGGTWNIPQLRELLAKALSDGQAMEDVGFTHEFPRIGLRNFLIHVRQAHFDDAHRTLILLAFEDVTDRRALEQEKERLQAQTDRLLKKEHLLVQEMQHRIVNSLQIIASILMLKAKKVASDETREHLRDAHRRIISVAEVQKFLHSTVGEDKIELAPYLTKLCTSLAASMIGEADNIKLQVECFGGSATSADAVSIGLVVTELVINALKYAFPTKKDSAAVTVRYELNSSGWRLSVSDNGGGKDETAAKSPGSGLGTSLVAALAHQLGAQVEVVSSPKGVSVSLTRATFDSALSKKGIIAAGHLPETAMPVAACSV